MKYFLSFCVFFVLSTSAFSQYKDEKSPTWLFVGAGGGFSNSMFFEKHFFEGLELTASAFNPSYSYFGKVGIGFPFNMALVYEYSMQTLAQKYEITSNVEPNKGTNFTNNVQVQTTGHTVLIRGGSPSSGYVEAGPRFSKITSHPSYEAVLNEKTNAYNSDYISIEFGFGGPLFYREAFDISLGVRLNYAVTNLMEDYNYPYAGIKYSTKGYSDLYTTNPFTFGLRLEMHWRILYLKRDNPDAPVKCRFYGGK